MIDLEDTSEANDKLTNKFSGLCKFSWIYTTQKDRSENEKLLNKFNAFQRLVEWPAHSYLK